MPIEAMLSGGVPDPEEMGTGHFQNVASKYISERVMATPFMRRAYVYELVALYRYIVNGVNSFASSMAYSRLRAKYPKEHLALLKEQNTDRYRALIGERKAEKARKHREVRESRRMVDRQKREWVAAGGKA
jgi:hypothetical protein